MFTSNTIFKQKELGILGEMADSRTGARNITSLENLVLESARKNPGAQRQPTREGIKATQEPTERALNDQSWKNMGNKIKSGD